LGKVTDDDYVFEGIQIACKWFCEVLAKSPQKKDQEMRKKVLTTLEEIEKSVH
jgi:hypothetical protein